MADATAMGQQHPLKVYFYVWGLLFLFSAFSYATDFLEHGYFRWFLILTFMFAKAGFIIAIFMHMKWERLALIWAILGPPLVLLVLIGLMAVEGEYTELTRLDFFSEPLAPVGHEAAH
jgi:cytochrome c oxidase subunit IV